MSKPAAKTKPRPAERDYSHRSILDKLGVKPGQRLLVLDIDDPSFAEQIANYGPAFTEPKKSDQFDLIFYAAQEKTALKHLGALRRNIVSNGAVWVVYPKGQPEIIRETDVISAAKSAGLVDNKVCSFSDTHTALRCVIPVAQRKK
jgi:hypothetical protein